MHLVLSHKHFFGQLPCWYRACCSVWHLASAVGTLVPSYYSLASLWRLQAECYSKLHSTYRARPVENHAIVYCTHVDGLLSTVLHKDRKLHERP